MTPETIALIRAQFALLKGNEAPFAAAFYARLFQIAPELRPMFPADLSQQGRKLITTLAFAVQALDRPAELAPVVETLGARHVAYGVTPAQFAPVGQALLDTLAVALGAAFDETARAAWTAAYLALAGMMTTGMQRARAA